VRNIVGDPKYTRDGQSCSKDLEEDQTLESYSSHFGGFSYIRQPLNVLHHSILFNLWSERCRLHFDGLKIKIWFQLENPEANFVSESGHGHLAQWSEAQIT
jgi:hypothetical protein